MLAYILNMEFSKQVLELQKQFGELYNEYTMGASLIGKLIYQGTLFDRYTDMVNLFTDLRSGLYSDKHIAKLLKSKHDQRILVINIYRSRALGLLAIADAIDKLNITDNMTNMQLEAFNKLQEIKLKMIRLAISTFDLSNNMATKANYDTYNVDLSAKYGLN